MSPELISLLTVLIQTAGAVLLAYIALKQRGLGQTMTELKETTNGKMQQLIDVTEKSAGLEGEKRGVLRQQGIEHERLKIESTARGVETDQTTSAITSAAHAVEEAAHSTQAAQSVSIANAEKVAEKLISNAKIAAAEVLALAKQAKENES